MEMSLGTPNAQEPPPPPRAPPTSAFFRYFQSTVSEEACPPQKLTLFLVPPAGSSSSFFEREAFTSLPKQGIVPVGLEMPKQYKLLPPDDYVHALRDALHASGEAFSFPYAILGHSAGSQVALRLAHIISTYDGANSIPSPIRVILSGANLSVDKNDYESWSVKDLTTALVNWAGDEKIDESLLSSELYLSSARSDLTFSKALLETNLKTPAMSIPSLISYGIDDPLSKDPSEIDLPNCITRTFPGGHHYFTQSTTKEFAYILLDDLSTLSRAATALVHSWNSAKTMDYPHNSTLHDMFAETLKNNWQHPAVIDGADGFELSYAELDYQSTLIARYLYHVCEVRPNTSTGILLSRTWQYLPCYLGALKAGGGYMPLEVVYPAPLLQRVLENTTPKCVLTSSSYASRVPSSTPHLSVDGIGWIKELEGMNLPPLPESTGATPDSLAYIVMSSGTTGTPKGIACPHRGAVHSYNWRHVNNPITPGVDISACNVFFVWECLRPILTGGTLLVVPDDVVYDPPVFVDLLRKYSTTRIQFTPSLLTHTMSSLTDDQLKKNLSTLQYVSLCGEVVMVDMVRKFNRLFPNTKLVNLYSISECHDVCQSVLYGPKNELVGPDRNPKYAPAGTVIDNVQLHVLDESLNECPIGVYGEVYVSGPCLAIGYWNKPEQTAERFPPNPIPTSKDKYPRIYRTGDRGRFLADGQLEIAGRVAFFVKIRGYSVVPSAVEATLTKHPSVASAVVLATGDISSHEKKLVAYVVPKKWELMVSQRELRDFCKNHLPPYSVPSLFVPLRALPVAEGTGKKMDAKKLPLWDSGVEIVKAMEEEVEMRRIQGGSNVNLAALSLSPNEQAVLSAWKRVVDTPPNVESTDSFYDVGGSSLLMAKLASELSPLVGRVIKIGELVGKPTLADMAVFVDNFVDNESLGKIKDAWLSVLGKDISEKDLSAISDFADCGGHSLALGKIAGILGVRVSDLIGKNSLGEMAVAISQPANERVRSTSTADEILNLPEEANLDVMIHPAASRRGRLSRYRPNMARFRPRRIFLTGATGYLGAFLLYEMAVIQEMPTYALVRAKDDESAWRRLVSVLNKYGLIKGTDDEDYDKLEDNVIAVCGDITEPLFGMSDSKFKTVSGMVDAVVHCAAEVNLFKSYVELKRANVLGTQEALRLSVTNGPEGMNHVKAFFHVSSNGVFPATWSGDRDEESALDGADVWGSYHDGYGQTKWVAERLVEQAGMRGLPICILRPGNMAAASGGKGIGAWGEHDFYALFLMAVVEVGVGIKSEDMEGWEMDLTPVDWAAEAIVKSVVDKCGRSLGSKVHIGSGRRGAPMADVLRWLGYEGGVPLTEFRSRVEEKAADGSVVCGRLAVGFDSFTSYFDTAGAGIFKTNVLNEFVSEGKENGLEKCPEIDGDYLRRALEFLGVKVPVK